MNEKDRILWEEPLILSIMDICFWRNMHMSRPGLDYVLFMPTMNPPHKADITVVSAEHRIKYGKTWHLKDNPHFSIIRFGA